MLTCHDHHDEDDHDDEDEEFVIDVDDKIQTWTIAALIQENLPEFHLCQRSQPQAGEKRCEMKLQGYFIATTYI